MKAQKMQAIVSTAYGGPEVLKIQTVSKPVPQAGEVLIRVHAVSITTADGMIRKGIPKFGRLFLGLLKPKKAIPGTGFAGVIEAIGPEVEDYKVGDAVFGETGVNFGAHAEYICMPESGVIAKKPINMTFAEAAPVCDGPLTALNFLKNLAGLRPDHHVLINGASGSIGTAAVQIAKAMGATVTGVAGPSNQEFMKSLGADYVLDYTKTDYAKTGHRYDIIFDTVGKRTFANSRAALTEQGIYMSPVLSLSLLAQMLFRSMLGGQQVKFAATGLSPVPELRQQLELLKTMIEAGQIKSVIDRRYQLEEVHDAHHYVDRGHKRGNVIMDLLPI